MSSATVATPKSPPVSLSRPIKDRDADGIPDDWELEKFGTLKRSGIGTDTDQDGFSDLDEMIAGTDPRDGKSYLNLITHDVPGKGILLKWRNAANCQYTILQSTSPKGVYNVLKYNIKSPKDSISYMVPAEFSKGRRYYYKLKVEAGSYGSGPEKTPRERTGADIRPQ